MVPIKSQKVVVIDVADIISVVGLMKQINGKVVVGKNTLYFPESYFVISPTTAFNSDMSKTVGKTTNVVLKKKTTAFLFQ